MPLSSEITLDIKTVTAGKLVNAMWNITGVSKPAIKYFGFYYSKDGSWMYTSENESTIEQLSGTLPAPNFT